MDNHLEFIRLNQERESLSRASRLQLFHWIIIGSSLLLTVFAWYFSKSQVEDKVRAQFERESSRVVTLLIERMTKYEDALWSGVSTMHSHDRKLTNTQWAAFASALHIEDKYPGINGIGVIYQVEKHELQDYLKDQRINRPDYDIHPAHNQDEYWPITYVVPVEANAKAVGLDMAHENNRYTAALKSRDTGTAQITGPIVLVQDSAKTPGFLFYVPFYKLGELNSVADYENKVIGLIYAPFIMKNLMNGVLSQESRLVGISVSDKSDSLYNELLPDNPEYDPKAVHALDVSVHLYGREWDFSIQSSKSFRSITHNNQPVIILLAGIFIDVMLFVIFVVLTRSNRKALDFVKRTTATLEKRSDDLLASNNDLEKFAYITSHDLKTPLRGISDLRSYLMEDLDGYFKSDDVNPDVIKNFDRLDTQVHRMDNLIKAILNYSSIGTVKPKIESVDLTKLCCESSSELGVDVKKIMSSGVLVIPETNSVQLKQVLQNLFSNAVKYHDDLANIKVGLLVSETESDYEFSVSDNGPGIEGRYHEKIFEAFQTLHTKDEIESTGIGLSIVKKIVESHGGKVILKSSLGSGAKFSFNWPKNMSEEDDSNE